MSIRFDVPRGDLFSPHAANPPRRTRAGILSGWVTASSWAAKEHASRIRWGKRDRKTEAELFSSFDVSDGPLAGLILKAVRCR